MRKNNASSQKYVDRFCSYLNRLLAAFDAKPGDTSLHSKYGSRACFLAIKLRLISEIDWNVLELFGIQGRYCSTLTPEHDQRYVEQQLAARAERRSKIEVFQQRARALDTETLTLSIPASKDHSNLLADVERFCELIDDMIEIWDIGRESTEVHRFGRKANRLAVKLGLCCSDRETALACGMFRSDDKLPYIEGQWSDGWTLNRCLGDSYNRPASLGIWQGRAKALLKKIKAKDISPEESKSTLSDLDDPISCAQVAAIVHEQSHNIANKLKRHEYPVLKIANKYYCEMAHAMVMWPQKRQALNKYSKNYEEK